MKIQNTSNVHQVNLKCLVYGASGIGKTTLAGTLEGKTLIVSAESGLASLRGTEIDYVDITQDSEGKLLSSTQRLENLGDIYKQLLLPETRDTYTNVFVDSLTEIADIVADHMSTEHPDKSDTFKMWGEYTKKMASIIRSFRDLPHYNVVFTCLEDETQDESKLMHYGPSMSGKKVKQMLVPMFDEVFRYCMHGDDRILVTSKTASSVAKDRSGQLGVSEEPCLTTIFKKIREEGEEK
jgi:phage nucleotide-binding protein